MENLQLPLPPDERSASHAVHPPVLEVHSPEPAAHEVPQVRGRWWTYPKIFFSLVLAAAISGAGWYAAHQKSTALLDDIARVARNSHARPHAIHKQEAVTSQAPKMAKHPSRKTVPPKQTHAAKGKRKPWLAK